MKVNLNIEEDDQFRSHVRNLIEGQVRAVLREQLNGIVAGEIAKLRLLQPNSPTLGEHVAKEVSRVTAGAVNSTNVRQLLTEQVRMAVAQEIAPMVKELRGQFTNQLTAALKA
jgi:hypothetical protein